MGFNSGFKGLMSVLIFFSSTRSASCYVGHLSIISDVFIQGKILTQGSFTQYG